MQRRNAAPPSGADTQLIEGEVERVTYEDDQTGFRILKVAVDNSSARLTVVGKMQRVVEGARVRVSGAFE